MARKKGCNRKPGNSRCLKKINIRSCPDRRCAKNVVKTEMFSAEGVKNDQNRVATNPKASGRYCKECYYALLSSEKICPRCLSGEISIIFEDEVQEVINPDKRLCRENPTHLYGNVGCLLAEAR